jgi:hypothetical protein
MVNWTYTTDQAGRRLGDRWHYMMGARFDNGAFFNFWSRSRIGALFINKSESGYIGDLGTDYYNRTYAIDGLIAPHPNFTIQGFISKTETPGIVIPVDDPATPIQEDAGYGEVGTFVNATWLDTKWRIFGEYADFENDFNPEVGFLPRNGIRTTKIHLERDPRPDFWRPWSTGPTRRTRPAAGSGTGGTT